MDTAVEIHIPISPTASFFRQVHYLAALLRPVTRNFSGTRLIVTVGDDSEPFDVAACLPWAAHYPIEFRWVPRQLRRAFGWFATALHRYRYTYDAPLVLMMDADIVVAREFGELLEQVRAVPAFYSMVAHASPWYNSRLLHLQSEEAWWRSVYGAAGLGEPEFPCQYTGFGYLGEVGFPRAAPPNFNQGVVIAPASIVRTVGSELYRELEHVNSASSDFLPVSGRSHSGYRETKSAVASTAHAIQFHACLYRLHRTAARGMGAGALYSLQQHQAISQDPSRRR